MHPDLRAALVSPTLIEPLVLACCAVGAMLLFALFVRAAAVDLRRTSRVERRLRQFEKRLASREGSTGPDMPGAKTPVPDLR
jgi:hypothetical protein